MHTVKLSALEREGVDTVSLRLNLRFTSGLGAVKTKCLTLRIDCHPWSTLSLLTRKKDKIIGHMISVVRINLSVRQCYSSLQMKSPTVTLMDEKKRTLNE